MAVLLTLVAYKIALVLVGLWASRRVASERDYFLAGGRLGPWTAGLSYAASTSSAWVLLGYTGAVYTRGAVALWLVPGIFAGYVLCWLVIGPRLHRETRERGHLTLPDFIAGDAGPLAVPLRRLCALILLFCFCAYIAAQFQAAGTALAGAFGIGATEAVLTGAAVIVLYCFLGGFLAASITDAVQAAVMLGACIVVPLAFMSAFPTDIGHALAGLRTSPSAGEAALWTTAGAALALLGTGLGALGQPQLLNRIMAVRSDRDRLRGAAITVVWGTLIYSALTLLAALARTATGFETAGEDLIFSAATAALPAVLAGIVVAAVLSAVMSTVDSLLLAAASAVSHDSAVPFRRPLLAGRLAMLAVAAVAVLLTLFLPATVFDRVLFAWVALGAAFGPTVLLRALGHRATPAATLAAVALGFAVSVGFSLRPQLPADLVEKWGGWAVGLAVLLLNPARPIRTVNA